MKNVLDSILINGVESYIGGVFVEDVISDFERKCHSGERQQWVAEHAPNEYIDITKIEHNNDVLVEWVADITPEQLTEFLLRFSE